MNKGIVFQILVFSSLLILSATQGYALEPFFPLQSSINIVGNTIKISPQGDASIPGTLLLEIVKERVLQRKTYSNVTLEGQNTFELISTPVGNITLVIKFITEEATYLATRELTILDTTDPVITFTAPPVLRQNRALSPAIIVQDASQPNGLLLLRGPKNQTLTLNFVPLSEGLWRSESDTLLLSAGDYTLDLEVCDAFGNCINEFKQITVDHACFSDLLIVTENPERYTDYCALVMTSKEYQGADVKAQRIFWESDEQASGLDARRIVVTGSQSLRSYLAKTKLRQAIIDSLSKETFYPLSEEITLSIAHNVTIPLSTAHKIFEGIDSFEVSDLSIVVQNLTSSPPESPTDGHPGFIIDESGQQAYLFFSLSRSSAEEELTANILNWLQEESQADATLHPELLVTDSSISVVSHAQESQQVSSYLYTLPDFSFVGQTECIYQCSFEGLSPQDYHLIVSIDPDNLMFEEDETNNIYARNISLAHEHVVYRNISLNPSFTDNLWYWWKWPQSEEPIGTGGNISIHQDLSTFATAPASIRVEVKSPNTHVWEAQFDQGSYLSNNLSLKKGQWYQLRFFAKSNDSRQIIAKVSNNNAPFEDMGLAQATNLSTAWTAYSYNFPATKDNNESRIEFDVGGNPIIIWFDDISLSEITFDNLLETSNDNIIIPTLNESLPIIEPFIFGDGSSCNQSQELNKTDIKRKAMSYPGETIWYRIVALQKEILFFGLKSSQFGKFSLDIHQSCSGPSLGIHDLRDNIYDQFYQLSPALGPYFVKITKTAYDNPPKEFVLSTSGANISDWIDLEVLDFKVIRKDYANDSNLLEATLRNNGRAFTHQFNIGAFENGKLIGFTNAVGYKSGEIKKESILTNSPPGYKNITVGNAPNQYGWQQQTQDPDNTNDNLTKTLYFEEPAQDVMVIALKVINPAPYQQTNLRYTVKNNGNMMTEFHVSDLRLQASRGVVWSSSTMFYGLRPKEEREITGGVTLYEKGNITVIARTDAGYVLSEVNETNNELSQVIYWNYPVDLTSRIWIANLSCAGKESIVGATYGNPHYADILSQFNITYRVNGKLAEEWTVDPAINRANDIRTMNVTFSEGYNTLSITVDAENKVQEINETNNVYRLTRYVPACPIILNLTAPQDNVAGNTSLNQTTDQIMLNQSTEINASTNSTVNQDSTMGQNNSTVLNDTPVAHPGELNMSPVINATDLVTVDPGAMNATNNSGINSSVEVESGAINVTPYLESNSSIVGGNASLTPQIMNNTSSFESNTSLTNNTNSTNQTTSSPSAITSTIVAVSPSSGGGGSGRRSSPRNIAPSAPTAPITSETKITARQSNPVSTRQGPVNTAKRITLTAETEIDLSLGEAITFSFKGNSHSIIHKGIQDGKIKLIVRSEPQEAFLAVGESQDFDLDRDTLSDIAVQVLFLDPTRLSVTQLPLSSAPQFVLGDKNSDTALETVYPVTIHPLIGALITLATILIILLGYTGFYWLSKQS